MLRLFAYQKGKERKSDIHHWETDTQPAKLHSNECEWILIFFCQTFPCWSSKHKKSTATRDVHDREEN